MEQTRIGTMIGPSGAWGDSGSPARSGAAAALRRVYRPWAFFGLDLALTWIPLWLLVAGQRLGWFEDSFALFALAGASATLSAVIFVHFTRVRGFARDFWVRAVDPRRIGIAWWPVILFLQLLINVVAVLFSTFGGGSLAQLQLSEAFLAAPLGFLAFTLVFGPIPEELGWRGYGLDALRSRMNLLQASLLLTVIWALWHLPLFFVQGSFQNGLLEHMPTLIAYVIAFVPASILMSWIYYRTNRSTLSAILFHFAGNAAGEMLQLELPTRVLQTVIACAVAAVVVWAEWPLFTQREFWVDFARAGAHRARGDRSHRTPPRPASRIRSTDAAPNRPR
ncbi:MAG: CPBP family intramembrane metalloprotease [Spirochaetes bacterium]|jgi:membrane protease YdiL (CAAX protease family)|nr:CPBP family intramembrane metalloprotease [Spirochaetota bacterium]